MAKQSKNLSLDPEAVRRGERYSELHQTNISQLVNNFLSSLPVGEDLTEAKLTPSVRRMLGIAAGARGVEDYREHLLKKYGGE